MLAGADRWEGHRGCEFAHLAIGTSKPGDHPTKARAVPVSRHCVVSSCDDLGFTLKVGKGAPVLLRP